ncbi:MAG: 30S ribosomal protein S2 [Lentisphaeria bacterium]|nr:30S ribosomal protein S2 [Lentisphaeria bacterium]
MMALTVQDLLEAGCHFGHQTKRWNPKMKDYVYGAKNGISIIDITKTIHQVADACNFLQGAVAKGANILFVGTKRQAQQIVREASEATDMNYVTERWMGGLLTNNATIRKSVKKMYEIDSVVADENTSLKKKEVALLSRQSEKLHKDLDGIASMKKLPDILVIVDVCHDDIAVKEARKLNIPIVAIVDTNGNPDLIDYPVAANDDAVKSIKVIMDTFVETIKDAAEIWGKKAAEEKLKAEAAAAEKTKEAGLRRRTAPGAKRPLTKRPARKTAKAADGEAAPAAEGEAAAEVKKAPRKPAVKKAAPKAEKAEKAEEAPKAE